MSDVECEMPKYRCHKEVWALKIASIDPSAGDKISGPNEETDGDFFITPENERYAPFKVDRAYYKKHSPQPGGYYVVYKDGYTSYSPAEAFEDGYTLIK